MQCTRQCRQKRDICNFCIPQTNSIELRRVFWLLSARLPPKDCNSNGERVLYSAAMQSGSGQFAFVSVFRCGLRKTRLDRRGCNGFFLWR